jgi:osmotically-inducible protein OsmY
MNGPGARDEPEHYLVERVRTALANDPRVSELELQVTIAAGKVFVSGTVPTEQRRRAVADVVRALLPDREVHNDTTVVTYDSPPEVEELS